VDIAGCVWPLGLSAVGVINSALCMGKDN